METSIPPIKLLKKEVKKITTIKNVETEDELIARLSNYPEWKALKDRIERKIEGAKASVEVNQSTMGEIDNFETYGIKCTIANLLVEELQSIIADVELTAKVIKENEERRKN